MRDAGGHAAAQVPAQRPVAAAMLDEMDGAAPAGVGDQRAARAPAIAVEKLPAGAVDTLGIKQDRAAVDWLPLEHRRRLYGRLQFLESRREVPQDGRLVHDAQPAELVAPVVKARADLDHVVDVALRVDAPRDGEPDQFQGCAPVSPNMTLPISTARMPPWRYRPQTSAWPGNCAGGMCGQKRRRVDVDRMSARRLDDRHPRPRSALRPGTRRCGCGSAGSPRRGPPRKPWAIASRSRPASPP